MKHCPDCDFPMDEIHDMHEDGIYHICPKCEGDELEEVGRIEERLRKEMDYQDMLKEMTFDDDMED